MSEKNKVNTTDTLSAPYCRQIFLHFISAYTKTSVNAQQAQVKVGDENMKHNPDDRKRRG